MSLSSLPLPGPSSSLPAQVACTWDHVRGMAEVTEKFTSSPAVHFRHQLIRAVLNLQSALGTQDLGLLHPVPYRDSHGAIVFVVVQSVKVWQTARWGCSII